MTTLTLANARDLTLPQAKVIAHRIASIDILRALTMVLMIFVNDLWTLRDAPLWMRHAKPGVDGIGLADVVYPVFIFIVGMSLFIALKNRVDKGDSNWQLLRYIAMRTAALLVMGLFLVNSETFNASATGFSKPVFNILVCTAFILIWNAYRNSTNRVSPMVARSVGIVVLLVLSIIYRGGTDGTERFAIQWWGILGGIAWAYFASALVMLVAGGNLMVLIAGWVFFCGLSMASKAGLVPNDGLLAFVPNPIRGGTFVGLALGGVITASLFNSLRKANQPINLTLVFALLSAGLIACAVYTRSFWGLSKLGRTPAWLFLCSAFTICTFIAVYWLADVKKKQQVFSLVKPAGTDTLLCYLMPYFLYAFVNILHLKLPGLLLTGNIGLLKSVLFALVCVWITAGLNRAGIALKL